MEDAPTLLKIPKSECPDIWRLPKHKWPKSWSSMEDPERNLNGHPLAGLLWKRLCEKSLLKYGWEAKRRRKKCGKIEIYSDELVFTCSDKFLIRKKSVCIQKSGHAHSYGDLESRMRRNFKIRRSAEFSSATTRCIPWWVNGHRHAETCRYERGIRICGPFRI